MDKILGSGMNENNRCYIIPNENLVNIEEYQDQLTSEQKRYLNEAKKTGSGLMIDPISKQRGGFLGALLGAVGIPLLLKAVTGSGLQNRPLVWEIDHQDIMKEWEQKKKFKKEKAYCSEKTLHSTQSQL